MLVKLLIALALMAICVGIHAVGVSLALRWQAGRHLHEKQFWLVTCLFIALAGWMVLLHLSEISVWALFYSWSKAMPDLPSAYYFSAVTYTTTGYGDLVLPGHFRLVGGVEALTGVLMCGWSTGFFFAAVSRVFETRSNAEPGKR